MTENEADQLSVGVNLRGKENKSLWEKNGRTKHTVLLTLAGRDRTFKMRPLSMDKFCIHGLTFVDDDTVECDVAVSSIQAIAYEELFDRS